jgi:phosphoribosylformylglycinamidine synthase
VIGPGGDAALVRIKREDGTATDKAVALSVDCNPRWCWLDPYAGTVAAVAEAARNVACTGARPLALTNCLNFGSPERPEIMWEFAEATRGLADAARALGTPVVSGNVSFSGVRARDLPAPTIAVGVLPDWRATPPRTSAARARDRARESRAELRGSGGRGAPRARRRAPEVDLDHERRLAELLVEGVATGRSRTRTTSPGAGSRWRSPSPASRALRRSVRASSSPTRCDPTRSCSASRPAA